MRIAAGVASAIGLLAGVAAQNPPARDVDLPPTAGTASISGTVVTDETPPQPVRRAIVQLTGPDLRPSRGAITDDHGRFTIDGLPAGRVTLTAIRATFVTSVYGARRPARPGTAITIADGEHLTGLTVRLWRGGVVAGVVRDESGAPVEGVPVRAVSARRPANRTVLTLSNNDEATTDDRGAFRIFGLEPGTYLVEARPSAGGLAPLVAPSDAEVEASLAALRGRRAGGGAAPPPAGASSLSDPKPFAYSPVYYPGTPVRGQAEPVTLAPGQEITGLDFALQRVSTAIVQGRLLRPDGQPAPGAEVQLTERMSTLFESDPPEPANTVADAGGVFRFSQVTPGEYALFARAPLDPATKPAPMEQFSLMAKWPIVWAASQVSVSGADVNGLALTLAPSLTMSGRVRFASVTRPPPEDLSHLRVSLVPPEYSNLRSGTPIRSMAFVLPGDVRPDGTFELQKVVPGVYVFAMAGPVVNEGWWPRSAVLDGRDLLDVPVEITADMNLSGVMVTLTDRRSGLSGTLQTSAGVPASDVFIVVYPAERGMWGPHARRIRAVRPGVDGGYSIADLPPGDYLLAAVLDADEGDWHDPAFLEQLGPGSVPVLIHEGEYTVQHLRLGGGDDRPDVDHHAIVSHGLR
jgi:hypothetical protein